MTDIRKIRKELGLTLTEMGQAIGYTGKWASTTLRAYESGARKTPPWIERLVFMYGKHGIPRAFREPLDD